MTPLRELARPFRAPQFFLHDPHAEDGGDGNMWFQGRFFPTAGGGDGTSRSPTSVLSAAGPPPSPGGGSWGLLAVQNTIDDGCLACTEGGYREVDLTFSRPTPTVAGGEEGKKKARWTARDVAWTGGDLLRLATDPCAANAAAPLRTTAPGVRFEPHRLVGGPRALELAAKCFPALVARLLRRHDVADERRAEVLVVVGDLEVAAPAALVGGGRAGDPRGVEPAEDDGLWED